MRNCMENLHAVDGGGHGINDDHQIDHDEETVSNMVLAVFSY